MMRYVVQEIRRAVVVTHDQGSKVLLTLDDVESWRAERKSIAEQLAVAEQTVDELKTALYELDQRLAFADALTKVGPSLTSRQNETQRSGGFIAWVKSSLQNKAKGLTYKELGELADQSEFSDQYQRNQNVLYNSVARLDERKEVIRVGKRIFDSETFELLEKMGLEPRDIAGSEQSEAQTMPVLVNKIVSSHPEGISTAAILKELRLNEAMALKMDRNPQYGYTVISRMTKRRQLERRGDLYVLGPEADDQKTDVFG